MINVICLYDERGMAQQAIHKLMDAGLDEDDVELLQEGQDGHLEQDILGFGISREHARLYARAVSKGKAVLHANAPDDRAEEIIDLLNENGARDIEEAAREFGGEESETQSIPEIEEELSVSKKKALEGGVRITTKVSERPVEKTVELKEEKIRVERKEGEGRKLSPEEAESFLEEGTREFTETREVPEVHKEARETGRVEVAKTIETREETVRDKVRKTEVHAEELEPERMKGKEASGKEEEDR